MGEFLRKMEVLWRGGFGVGILGEGARMRETQKRLRDEWGEGVVSDDVEAVCRSWLGVRVKVDEEGKKKKKRSTLKILITL